MQSPRNIRLAWSGPLPTERLETPRQAALLSRGAVLTVELHIKWYSLFLVEGVCVSAVSYSQLEAFAPKGESPYVDHVPNPEAVQRLCAKRGWTLDYLALELLIGRWEWEVKGTYSEDEKP